MPEIDLPHKKANQEGFQIKTDQIRLLGPIREQNKHQFENQPEKTNVSNGGIFGTILSALAGVQLVAAVISLLDNERQRKHERKMARLAPENPNSGITVQTGRIHCEKTIALNMQIKT